MKKQISIDFSNASQVKEVIAKHNTCRDYLFGENNQGEDMWISVSTTGINTIIYQNNGWIRHNKYDDSGCMVEEWFEGRWK